jgi:uncharacterized phage protein (TIGR01671 family)
MAMSVRKIEFRAWDKREKRMGEVTGIRFSKSQYPCVNVRFKQNGKIIDERYCFGQEDGCDNVILMQFTGLYDKNGKEIYEGDVVRIDDLGIGIVDYEEGRFAMRRREERFCWPVYCRIDRSSFVPEVIGNIYENHELLKE